MGHGGMGKEKAVPVKSEKIQSSKRIIARTARTAKKIRGGDIRRMRSSGLERGVKKKQFSKKRHVVQ